MLDFPFLSSLPDPILSGVKEKLVIVTGKPGSGKSQVLRDLIRRHEISKLLSDLCQEPNDIASLTFNCLPVVKSSPQFSIKSVSLLDSSQRAHDIGLHVVNGGAR